MDILFTGNLSVVSTAFIKRLDEENKYILFGVNIHKDIKNTNTVICRNELNEETQEKIFTTFDFKMVVFFSYALDGVKKIADELESLENILKLCKKRNVDNFIYIKTNEFYNNANRQEDISRQVILEACDNLCRSFSEAENIKFMLLNVPYMYGIDMVESRLYEWIKLAYSDTFIEFPGNSGRRIDFLCDADLGELVARIIDEPPDKTFYETSVCGKNDITFEELGNIICENIPQTDIRYANKNRRIPVYCESNELREEYGWYPLHDVRKDIRSVIENIRNEIDKREKKRKKRQAVSRTADSVRKIIELIALFILAQCMNEWVKGNVIMNFIDFRLIYITILGTMNGLYMGIAAALLSCLGYVYGNVKSGIEWQILFYNIQNWMPFACYFIMGTATGYKKDKREDLIKYSREENEILEKKYTFLTEMYERVLENKDSFNSQIIGYRNSFGKIYSVVKRINIMLPDRVFMEAVSVLEEILETDNIAIYTINEISGFARLNVCSRTMNYELGKSLDLSDYSVMSEKLRKNEIFINRDCLPGYPSYATPVFRNGELFGMILLMYANDSQMNMEFSNKFNIITDLIRDSLIRAMEYEELEDIMITGTSIVRSEKFKEILEVKEQMRRKQYMDYVLLKVDTEHRNAAEMSDKISRIVRNNDVIGMGEDGNIYLILSQANREGMAVIAERMKKNSIHFEVVKSI